MNKREELYQNDALWADFYRGGMTLGELREKYGCSLYDLSPWLTTPLVQNALSRSFLLDQMPKERRELAEMIITDLHSVGGREYGQVPNRLLMMFQDLIKADIVKFELMPNKAVKVVLTELGVSYAEKL